MNFDSDGIEEYNSLVAAIELNKYQSKPKLELDVNHHKYTPARPSIVDTQKLDLSLYHLI